MAALTMAVLTLVFHHLQSPSSLTLTDTASPIFSYPLSPPKPFINNTAPFCCIAPAAREWLLPQQPPLTPTESSLPTAPGSHLSQPMSSPAPPRSSAAPPSTAVAVSFGSNHVPPKEGKLECPFGLLLFFFL